MLIDLHSHTTASDGQYSPSEMVMKAYDKGIRYYSITDHDTVAGITEALSVVNTKALDEFVFIPGIEISTQDSIEIHIVGIGIDADNSSLLEACKRFEAERDSRGMRICEYLASKGIEIDYEAVKMIAGDGNLGRPHFAYFLLEHGYVTDKREAFHKYLDTDEFHEAVDRVLPAPSESVDLIHNAGGLAVLAHPGIYALSEEQLSELFIRLKMLGIDGIECFYSKHSLTQTEQFLSHSDKLDLLVSCGSDYHGGDVKPDIALGMDVDFEKVTVLNYI